jgi:hypothetical protein
MAIFRFGGRVLPISQEFTMFGSLTVNWKDVIEPDVTLEMSASISITRGIVDILCDSNLHGNANADGQVHLRASDLANAVVNIYGFGKGVGLSVALENVVKPDGLKYTIEESKPDLAQFVTVLHPFKDARVDINPVLPIVLGDSTIFVALNDLVGSITRIQDAPMKCGRAVDAVRHAMAPADDRKGGWPAMRDKLNVTQPFLEFLTEQSKGPRHGDLKGGTFEINQEVLRRAWIVLNRFLEFKKRGDQPLPVQDFPVLDN